MQKSDLVGLHDDLATYYSAVTKRAVMLVQFAEKRYNDPDDEEFGEDEYLNALNAASIDPRVLTAIQSFLRHNDIRVEAEKLGEEVQEYEKQLDMLSRQMSVTDMPLDIEG